MFKIRNNNLLMGFVQYCYFKRVLCFWLICFVIKLNVHEANACFYNILVYIYLFRLEDNDGKECEALSLLWELIGSKQVRIFML